MDFADEPSDALAEQLEEAARLFDGGDPHAALELLLALEQKSPQDPTVLCMLGTITAETEAGGMAYDYFRRCLAAHPEDPELLVLLGAGLARYDDPDAEGVLRLAALTAPGVAATRLRYGAYLAREGILDLALGELQAAHELDPENGEVRREMGVAYLLSGDDPHAAEALRDAVTLAPDDADSRLLLGLALLRAGDLAEAAEELHAVSSVLTDDAEVQLLAALACASQEWGDEAWNALARAEGASLPPDGSLVREVEDAIEGGSDAARDFLTSQLAPSVLRERLLTRD